MAIDIGRIIGAVTRGVESGERDGRSTRIVVASRLFPTDRDDVWDAITNPERIPRWFMPISGELRLGGRYQLHGNAGGEILRCDRPSHLGVTWEMQGQASWVDVRLSPQGGKTHLELRHEAHVPPELWEQFGPGAVGLGWDLGIMGLDLHLGSGDSLPPGGELTFLTTPDGKEFVARAGEDWCRAAIAGGESRDQAEAAAARAREAYTAS